jgi:four helix bundle protein
VRYDASYVMRHCYVWEGLRLKYSEWEKTIPEEIRADLLWKITAYRLALFLTDMGWRDVTRLMQDKRTIKLAEQLYDSLGSVSANIAEGYSRGTGRDRARFYEYALGSARESRDWYFKGRHLLGDEVFQHRIKLLTRVILLLLTMVPQQRGRILREEKTPYRISSDIPDSDEMCKEEFLKDLLQNVPMPKPDV